MAGDGLVSHIPREPTEYSILNPEFRENCGSLRCYRFRHPLAEIHNGGWFAATMDGYKPSLSLGNLENILFLVAISLPALLDLFPP